MVAGRAEGLDKCEVSAVRRKAEVCIVLAGIESASRDGALGGNDTVAAAAQQVKRYSARIRRDVSEE